MFGKDNNVTPADLERVPGVSPEVAKLVADADPAVLRQALADITVARRLKTIEVEINGIGKERAKLAARATKLTHEREELLGQKPSAIAACAKKVPRKTKSAASK